MILDKIYYAAFDTQNLKILLLTKKKEKKASSKADSSEKQQRAVSKSISGR